MTDKDFSFSFMIIIMVVVIMTSCKSPVNNADDAPEIKTKVSITHPSLQNITEYIKLNGVTVFQKKNNIRSTNTGYIASLQFKPGDAVIAGKLFCTIDTKEQEALKNISSLDSSLIKFQKPISVLTNGSGIITAINVLQGDYVSEGDVLATYSVPSSLIVQVNVPYEFNNTVSVGKECEIVLPDGKIIHSSITGIMPSVDITSQSQSFFIRLPDQHLPENLNVTIRIAQRQKNKLLALPLSAVQTDEMQKEFWVMKLVNDSLAVKVPVKTGLQNDSLVEIVSDKISVDDIVILQGAYGLSDSTLVTFEKQ